MLLLTSNSPSTTSKMKTTSIKNLRYSWAEWCTPWIPTLQKERQVVFSPVYLHKFQYHQSYMVGPSQKTNQPTNLRYFKDSRLPRPEWWYASMNLIHLETDGVSMGYIHYHTQSQTSTHKQKTLLFSTSMG